MWDNPISGQASRLILDALKDNTALEKLILPSYPVDVTQDITVLQQVVNKERKRQGCKKKLEIEFD